MRQIIVLRRLVVVAIVAVLGMSATSAQAQPAFVASCQVITQPGSYIVVTNIFYNGGPNGTCLTIFSNFVTLNLGGFVITGNGAGGGIVVASGLTNGVTVSDGTVTNFAVGVSGGGIPASIVIERVRAIKNTQNGIQLLAGTIRDSFADGNGNVGVSMGSGNGGGTVVGSISQNNRIGLVAHCPSLLLGNYVAGNTTNTQLNGAGCVTDHNLGIP